MSLRILKEKQQLSKTVYVNNFYENKKLKKEKRNELIEYQYGKGSDLPASVKKFRSRTNCNGKPLQVLG